MPQAPTGDVPWDEGAFDERQQRDFSRHAALLDLPAT